MLCHIDNSHSQKFRKLIEKKINLKPKTIFAGACSTLARLGALLAPTIADLDSVAYFLPFLIMGGSSVVVGILAFLLPETRGQYDWCHQWSELQTLLAPIGQSKIKICILVEKYVDPHDWYHQWSE